MKTFLIVSVLKAEARPDWRSLRVQSVPAGEGGHLDDDGPTLPRLLSAHSVTDVYRVGAERDPRRRRHVTDDRISRLGRPLRNTADIEAGATRVLL